MFWMFCALALGSSPAQIATQITSVTGWTADGATLVTRELHEVWNYEGSQSNSTLAVLHGDQSGCFVTDGDPVPRCEDAEAYADWKKAHPLLPAKTGATCGDAQAFFQFHETTGYPDAQASGEWKDDAFVISGLGEGVTIHGILLAGHLWNEQSTPFRRGFELWGGAISLKPYWSATCAEVVLVKTNQTLMGARTGYAPELLETELITRIGGPTVQVLAPDALGGPRAAVTRALEGAGIAVTEGTALKDRPETVIYAWTKARPLAERLQQKIPGAATIEPFTWESKADVVIALGNSAK